METGVAILLGLPRGVQGRKATAQIFRKTSVVSAGLISYKRARLRPDRFLAHVTPSPPVLRSVAFSATGRAGH